MKKERYEKVKSYQLIVEDEFLRLLKSEAAKDGKNMKEFIVEAVKKLIDEKNKKNEALNN